MEEKLAGVYPAVKKDKTIYYRASLTHMEKHISLGSFPDAQSAHRAYLDASELLRSNALSIADFSKERTVLSFEKWVCLVNLRSNRLYFHTPIFLYPKFFHYYLSPAVVLKFDIDDLFYYSSHKIMKRGTHLFVADYGMQVNILNRYGIKNYAVKDRDYRFINGDSNDFRYENIEIINRFCGVAKQENNGAVSYRTKIHINGDYIVGTYKTEIEAAVAYNKAIDYLKKAGVQKNYTPNFIDSLSPSMYAEIYAALPVSPKIKAYLAE